MKRTILTLAAALGVFGAGLGVGQAGLLTPPAAAAQTVAQAPAAVAQAPAPAAPAATPATAQTFTCTAPAATAPATPPAPAQAPTREGLVNLNTATEAELDALPDTAKGRIKHITEARPIRSIDDLAGPGMPDSYIAMLKVRATV